MYFPANEKNIKIDFEGSHESYFIPADVEQMEQALINIIKNAIEAIENTGKITLILDQSKQMLIISDTGKGISQQDTEQLFSPFFSTKKDGQGIGLTLVREILLNHSFDFSLKTIQPNETQFSIKFISG